MRKSFNQLTIFGENPELNVVIYKPLFDMSWTETL